MSIPYTWIEEIFRKLTVTYGREFMDRWRGLDMNDVKTDWAHELGGFSHHPEAIDYALANLPVKAPGVLEFRAICRAAPAKDTPRIEGPRADPKRVQQAMARLETVRTSPRNDPKAWARRHIAAHERGERVRPITLRFAREAMGIRDLEG